MTVGRDGAGSDQKQDRNSSGAQQKEYDAIEASSDPCASCRSCQSGWCAVDGVFRR